MSKSKFDMRAAYFLDDRKGNEDYGVIWKIKGRRLWAWDAGSGKWEPFDSQYIVGKARLTAITPEHALSLISQVKLPLHIVSDAQGPMGIMDADGKAVAWFSDLFKPSNGYAWQPEPEATSDHSTGNGVTYYSKRNWVIRSILAHLEELLR